MEKHQKILLTIIVVLGLLLGLFTGFSYISKNSSDSLEEIDDCGEGTVIYNNNDDFCWQKSVKKTFTTSWDEANNHCEELTLANEIDWRLPTLEELDSIVDQSFIGISINPAYFEDTTDTPYWTSSEYNEDSHWFVDFSKGFKGEGLDFKQGYGVRCVRKNTLL